MRDSLPKSLKSTFVRLGNSAIWRSTLVYTLLILIGVVIAAIILRFPLPHTFALILGTTLLLFSVYKIEIPFYVFVFLLIMMVEVSPVPGSIFGFFTERDITGLPTLLEIVFGLLLLSFLLRFLLQRDVMLVSRENVVLMIFLGLLVISVWIGLQKDLDRITLKEDFKRFFIPAFFFIPCINILNSRKKVRFLLVFGFAVTLIKSCLGIFYYLMGKGFLYEGSIPVVFLDNSDHLLFVTIIVVIVSSIIYGKAWGYWRSLLLISPFVFSVVFSYRRHAWLGLLLSLVILFLLVPGTRKFKMVAISLIVSLTVTILISFSIQTASLTSEDYLVKRFLSIADREQSSNIAHIREWEITFEDTMKSPVLGLGLGSTHRPVPGYAGIPRTTVHNAFLMLWMKMGIIAVLLFCWSLFHYVKFGIRVARDEDDSEFRSMQVGLFASIGVWAISLNTGPSWSYYRETCLMVLVASVVVALSRVKESDSDLEKQHFPL